MAEVDQTNNTDKTTMFSVLSLAFSLLWRSLSLESLSTSFLFPVVCLIRLVGRGNTSIDNTACLSKAVEEQLLLVDHLAGMLLGKRIGHLFRESQPLIGGETVQNEVIGGVVKRSAQNFLNRSGIGELDSLSNGFLVVRL